VEKVFSYRALEPSGGEVLGEVQSLDRAGALDVLHRKGLIPIDIGIVENVTGAHRGPIETSSRPPRRWLSWRKQELSLRDWLSLTQSLTALLKAGLPVDRALQIAMPLAQSGAAQAVIARLLESVRQGATLSEAFVRHGSSLPGYYSSMVSAGEASGSLPAAMSQLVGLISRQVAVRERLRSALIYPGLLASMVLVTLIVLLVFVLPRFELLFAESTSVLPLSTRVVLALGRGVSRYWWLGLGFLGAGGAWGFLRWRSESGREQFDRWMLRSRWTLGLPSAIDGARLLRTVGTLCEGGQPLPAALHIAQGTVANRGMQTGLKQVIRDVQAGATLSQSMSKAGVFPMVAVQMSRVGEETGHLEQMLQAAADVLEEESQRRLEQLVTLAVPLMTIVMGLIVAVLIGSVLIGLLSINDLAM
jgi:general secretion pathway protein F